jgi:hypothetical protein
MTRKKLTDEQWSKEILDFFGSPSSSLGTATKTIDECVSFARELLLGDDPYKSERLSKKDFENARIREEYSPRLGDALPYLYIKYNLLDIPPGQLNAVLRSSWGKMQLEALNADFSNLLTGR